jgi:hypothetical protein
MLLEEREAIPLTRGMAERSFACQDGTIIEAADKLLKDGELIFAFAVRKSIPWHERRILQRYERLPATVPAHRERQ